jgi:hypothetical protein
MVTGLRFVVYGDWLMVAGLRSMVNGVWFMIYFSYYSWCGFWGLIAHDSTAYSGCRVSTSRTTCTGIGIKAISWRPEARCSQGRG